MQKNGQKPKLSGPQKLLHTDVYLLKLWQTYILHYSKQSYIHNYNMFKKACEEVGEADM